MDAYEEFLLTIRRDINCLNEKDKVVRRNSLIKLEKAIRSNRKVSEELVLRAFLEELHKPLLRLLSDQGEKCRELSIELLSDFLSEITHNQLNDLLPLVLSAVLGRICTQPFPEQSEEIRVEILELIEKICELAKELIIPFTHDVVDALANALHDSCPDAKKKCCSLVTRITSITEPARLANCAAPLVQSLVTTLKHRHWKVRKAALESLKDLLCSVETLELLSDLVPHLAPILSDGTPQVRLCLSQCLEIWLRRGMNLKWPGTQPDFDNLEAEVDFDKFEHRLLYLLISIAADEEESVSNEGFMHLQQVALESEHRRQRDIAEKKAKAEQERADDIAAGEEVDDISMKDAEAMSVDEIPAHIPELDIEVPLAGYRKPAYSTAVYVGRHYSKLIPQALNSILEWTQMSQTFASRFLRILLGLAPQGIPPFLEQILVHLYRATVPEAMDVATMIGLFVQPDLTVELVAQHLGLRQNKGANGAYGVSEVVGRITTRQVQSVQMAKNFVASSPETKKQVLKIFQKSLDSRVVQDEALAEKIFQILDPHATQDELHEQTLECLESLLKHTPTWVHSLWGKVFDIGLLVMMTPSFQTRIDTLLEKVASMIKQPISELYAIHLESHMDDLLGESATKKRWSDSSPKAHILDALMRRSSTTKAANFDRYFARLVPVLACQAAQEASPHRRCDLLGLVHYLLSEPELREQLKKYSLALVMDVLLPNAIWKPGQSNNKIRKGALLCIHSTYEAEILQAEDIVKTIQPEILPILKSALDDSWAPDNRLVACMIISRILDNLLKANYAVPGDMLRDIYPELLKRMDDSNDEIRKKVCETFTTFFKCLPPRWSDSLYEYIIHALFIHLDDPNSQLQNAVYQALEVSIHYNPEKFLQEAKQAHSKASHPRKCQDLVRIAESLGVVE